MTVDSGRGRAGAGGALRAAWAERARARPMRIAFPDAEDPRVLAAAVTLAREGLARPQLFGDPAAVAGALRDAGVALPADVPVLDPSVGHARRADTLRALAEQRGRRLPGDAAALAADPLHAALLAVRAGEADGCVAGSRRPTAEVVRAGLRVLGLRAGTRTVSSSFVIRLADGRHVAYGDCGVVPEPDSATLADIALDTAATFSALTGVEARVALLSFSTRGSAGHAAVERVRRATDLVRQRRPELCVDGELQFDAAWSPAVAAVKAPDSPVAGRANVFVFPNLDAGNIGYKITERLAGAAAFGPLLQGLAAPLNDLSRGCTAEDVVTVGLVTALQAQGAGGAPGAGGALGAGAGDAPGSGAGRAGGQRWT